MSRLSFAALAAAVSIMVLPSAALAREDFAGQARYVLAPGAAGGLPAIVNSTDQAKLYDTLTPLGSNVSPTDLSANYLSEKFGDFGAVVTTENTGRAGLSIVRGADGVPHITGATRADTTFGMGYVAAKDRFLLLKLGLGPAYAATLDIPGVNAFGLVVGGRAFTPSKQAKKFVAKQADLLKRTAEGRQILEDFTNWAAGVNAYNQREQPASNRMPTVGLTDAIAAYAFIGSIFGNGGGGATQASIYLARLQKKFGTKVGLRIFRELRQVNEPEATTSIPKAFPYNLVPEGQDARLAAGRPGVADGEQPHAPCGRPSPGIAAPRTRCSSGPRSRSPPRAWP